MIPRRSKTSIGFLAALLAAALSVASVGAAFAGNGGDTEEQGTPSPDPTPPDDGDESNGGN